MSPEALPSPPSSETEKAPRAFRLVVEYDGTGYAGWQRQENAPSVQQTLEEALERIVRHPVRCSGAGRTDAGVHALGQVARFTTTAPNVGEDGLMRGCNSHLPGDVRIVAAQECPLEFDPRRDARLRHYRYSILTRTAASALDRHRLLHMPFPIDWAVAERALALLEGEHDFSPFRSSMCQATRTRLNLRRARHVDEHPVHHFEFACRSFLHNMVRRMTGLVIDIARGRLAPETVLEFFEAGRPTVGFRSAAPHGLALMRVVYPEEMEAEERELAR